MTKLVKEAKKKARKAKSLLIGPKGRKWRSKAASGYLKYVDKPLEMGLNVAGTVGSVATENPLPALGARAAVVGKNYIRDKYIKKMVGAQPASSSPHNMGKTYAYKHPRNQKYSTFTSGKMAPDHYYHSALGIPRRRLGSYSGAKTKQMSIASRHARQDMAGL